MRVIGLLRGRPMAVRGQVSFFPRPLVIALGVGLVSVVPALQAVQFGILVMAAAIVPLCVLRGRR